MGPSPQSLQGGRGCTQPAQRSPCCRGAGLAGSLGGDWQPQPAALTHSGGGGRRQLGKPEISRGQLLHAARTRGSRGGCA